MRFDPAIQLLNFRVARMLLTPGKKVVEERVAFYARKDLNPVRTSFAKIIGSSHAAKCPPVSGLLK
ncbi:hypothetical protein LMG29542_06594 [Paraburkholderia humisilvae]|uniref:Uncharacterized protein n=1 Tax=Paraburkholderia humisilvae TaxID=627669 RepID=A0A6J5EXN0_9BURK|nr:hypothetical protein LMG29542_06594 [Paraburkholderia humisilvae]